MKMTKSQQVLQKVSHVANSVNSDKILKDLINKRKMEHPENILDQLIHDQAPRKYRNSLGEAERQKKFLEHVQKFEKILNSKISFFFSKIGDKYRVNFNF